MKQIQRTLGAIAAVLAAALIGCSTENGFGEHDSRTEARGEHDREGGEHGREGAEGGEEAGTELALGDTYDKVRNGARLVLAYDAQSNSFVGSVHNTTEQTLKSVRVEVHLSNGKELGPTTPVDLAPGAKQDIRLAPTSRDFDGWTAHPEVGTGEHGGEGGDEHGREGRGEHR